MKIENDGREGKYMFILVGRVYHKALVCLSVHEFGCGEREVKTS